MRSHDAQIQIIFGSLLLLNFKIVSLLQNPIVPNTKRTRLLWAINRLNRCAINNDMMHESNNRLFAKINNTLYLYSCVLWTYIIENAVEAPSFQTSCNDDHLQWQFHINTQTQYSSEWHRAVQCRGAVSHVVIAKIQCEYICILYTHTDGCIFKIKWIMYCLAMDFKWNFRIAVAASLVKIDVCLVYK